uniref:Protein krueppel n=1 Tax=Anopheles dirus TaxID=7168 RepID=A0A182NW90_9DIPT
MAHLTICRLCLVKSCASFEVLTVESPFVEIICNVTTLQVLANESDTVLLCGDCQLKLIQFDYFREACVHNDEVYRQLLVNSIEIKTEHASDDESNDIKMVTLEMDTIQQHELIDETESHEIKKEQSDETEISKTPPRRRSTTAPKQSEPKTTERRKKSSAIEKKHKNDEPHSKVKTRSDNRVTKSKVSKAKTLSPTTRSACVRCGKMILNCNMNRHMTMHDTKPDHYSCPHCDKHFKLSHLLKVHINTHHTFEKKFECNDCGKVFYSQDSLRRHGYEYHSLVDRFHCTECGMTFNSFGKKKYHYLKVHTDEKPYTCQYCGRNFKMRSDLTLHLRT